MKKNIRSTPSKQSAKKNSWALVLVLSLLTLVILFSLFLEIRGLSTYEDSSLRITGAAGYETTDYGTTNWAGPVTSAYASYTHRQNITINKSKVYQDMVNYTFEIFINDSTNNIFTTPQASGNDIGFSDSNGNVIPAERQFYSQSTKQLLYWVKVPVVNTSVDTVLYMYYGSAGASDQSNKTGGAWDSKYSLVYFMNETNPKDHTATSTNATGTTVSTINSKEGIANSALNFTSSESNVNVTNTLFVGNWSNYTIIAWANNNATGTDQYIFSETKTSDATPSTSIRKRSSHLFAGWSRVNNGTHNNDVFINNGIGVNDGSWRLWTKVQSNNTRTSLYMNEGNGSQTASDNITITNMTTNIMTIGATTTGAGSSGSWMGTIGTFMILNYSLQQKELQTIYENQKPNSTFYTLSAEDVAPNVTLNVPANASTTTAGRVDFNFTPTAGSNSLYNCTLYHNASGTFSANTTITTLTNNTNTNITITIIPGTYTWNVQCFDTAGFNTFSIGNYTVTTTDSAPPAISYQGQTPTTASYQSSTTTTINTSVVDTFTAIGSCILEWSGTNQTMTKIGSGVSVGCNATKVSLSDGYYSYKVFANDTVGNMNVSDIRNVTIDSINPTATLNNPSNNSIGIATSITFNTTVSDNNLNNVTLFIDGVANETNTSGTNTTYVFLKTLPEGTHTWNILTYDKAGNSNQTGTRTFTIDSTNPQVVLVSPSNNSYSSTTTINFTTTSTDRAINNVTVYIDGVLNETNSSGTNGTYTFSKTLSEGNHTWYILAYDTAGNSNQSGTRTFTIDTTAPTTSLDSPQNTTLKISSSITFNGSVSDTNLANVTLYLDSVANDTNTSGTSTNYTFTKTLTDGNHTWSILAYDGAGNSAQTGTRLFTIDTGAPPVVVLNSPANNSVQQSVTVLFNSTATDSSINNITLYIDGVANETNNSRTSGDYLFIRTLMEGIHTWNVLAYDTAGNSNQSLTRTVVVDVTTPGIVLNTPLNSSYSSSSTINFTANVTDRELRNVTLYIDNVANDTNSSGLNTTYTFSKILSEGTHTWYVVAYDTAGNSNQSGTRTVMIDTTPPTINSVVVNTSTGISGDTFTVSVNATDEGAGINTTTLSVRYEKNASAIPLSTTLNAGLYVGTWNTTGYPNGTYLVSAYANDSLGTTQNKTNHNFIILSQRTVTTLRNISVNLSQGTSALFNTTANTTISISPTTNIFNATILVATYETNTENSTPGTTRALNKTIHITVDNETNSNIGTAFINVTYNETLVNNSGMNESTLRIFKYNTTLNNWTTLPNTGVDTTTNTIWANVTSFSIYGVFGNTTTVSESVESSQQVVTGSGGGGGGSSSTTTSRNTTTNTTASTPTTETTTLGTPQGVTTKESGVIKDNRTSLRALEELPSVVSNLGLDTALNKLSVIVIIGFIILLSGIFAIIIAVRKKK